MVNMPGKPKTPQRVQSVEQQIREGLASVAQSFAKSINDLYTRILAQIQGQFYDKATADGRFAAKAHNHAASDITSGGTTGAGFTVGGNLGVNGGITATGGGVSASGPVSGSSLSASGGVSGTTVSATGAVSGGSVASSADLRGVNLYATGAPGYVMSGTRVAGWWESATGRAGTASSSRRFKQDIEPANMDVNAILAIEVVHYHYIAEIRKRDDPTFEDYVGPSYKVATEVGVIAEQLHALGLWQFVVYQRENYTETRTRPATLTRPVLDEDGNPTLDDAGNPITEQYEGEEEYLLYLDRLKLDDAGKPIPDGVHYELLALATIPVLQDHERRIAALERAATTATPDTNQEK